MKYDTLIKALSDVEMVDWADILPGQIEKAFDEKRHGNLAQWRNTISQLPQLAADKVALNQAAVTVQSSSTLDADIKAKLKELLQQLHPWRKGPYNIHDVYIDTEWHSDWKWDRVSPYITPLKGRTVLDVGCGSGYHSWRMAGEGAQLVVGIDPSILFAMQFEAIKHFIGNDYPVYMLPLGIEAVPAKMRSFDTVFSMGVLYHRKSPIDHLTELRDCLKPGGELVLETLIIDGDDDEVLMPEERYAKMRNVWFIPSIAMLELWLRRCGYKNVRVVDVNQTSVEEQRSTEWMRFESLSDFLNPENDKQTIEGYPGPLRATVIAEAS
ncbi:MAG: tRNA 5-methoxyuridine(34)/uridine 5-oxyacetic acid(34) synthase CmoB [Gammaproteobacteria bacterium]|nr:tRNA 5-methoxyuridine(34)/uridine 5-oxyacetic acid(34) synthase CmoB [Gammaproteobacteria bacterium]